MLTIADFYCGVGGIGLGFHLTGKFQTVYAIDSDPHCKMVYDVNNSIKCTLQDINTVDTRDIPQIDVLCAGFNCQPFSIAGERRGFDDPRTNSLLKIFDIIRVKQPRCVFLENVKGIITHDNGKTFQSILDKLKESGMEYIFWTTCNTCTHTNIPQNRERVFITAFRNKVTSFEFPETISKLNPWREYLEPNSLDKYYYKPSSAIYSRLLTGMTNPESIYQYRRGIVRENKSEVCPTLVATMGTGGHNVPLIIDDKGIRKLTPRECFNLQGFPSTFILPKMADSHLYKQAGNTVTIPLIQIIANSIARVLS